MVLFVIDADTKTLIHSVLPTLHEKDHGNNARVVMFMPVVH